MIHWKLQHRKYAYSSNTLLMNTLNSGRVNHIPSSIYRSYNRIPQSKSMLKMPRGHIGTYPSTSSYFVTLSLEYPKAPSRSAVRSLIGLFVYRCKPVSSSVVRSPIGIFVFRSNPVSKVYQHRSWWNFRSSLIDGEFHFCLI